MADKQLYSALAKFSKSGYRKDLEPLYLILLTQERTMLIADVPLNIALQVCERCVATLATEQTPDAWFCLYFFIHGQTYKHAEAFANSFLHSGAAIRAFQCAKTCIDTFPGRGNLETLLTKLFQFLSYALWHESHAARVLLAQADTYRVAFEFVTDNCSVLSEPTRLVALTIFENTFCGRTDRPSGCFEKELCQALGLIITCGGLPAFAALFWEMCRRGDPTDLKLLHHCCTELFRRARGIPLGSCTAVELALTGWCANDATSSKGMLAGFYAVFEASLKPHAQSLNEIYSSLTATAGYFLYFLWNRGSPKIFELACQYPHGDCKAFPSEESCLYKYLGAVRKTGSPQATATAVSGVMRMALFGDPWVMQTIQLFRQHETEKQGRTCALPGCEEAGTPLRLLRKCGRCLAVCYCGSAHQRAHWPTHKRSCVKPAAADTAGTTEALAGLSTAEAEP
jgi:hypothetical protein